MSKIDFMFPAAFKLNNRDYSPSFNEALHKGVYCALLAKTVANLNPWYAAAYGLGRGSLDIPISYVVSAVMESVGIKEKQINENGLTKLAYLAIQLFTAVAVVYGSCKVGEWTYWGAKSIIGKADYLPFSMYELMKVEATFFLFTVVLEGSATVVNQI